MIEVIPRGGLCNRMRVIASAVSLAKDSGQPLVINWRLNDELGCSFFQLFKRNNAFKIKERENFFSWCYQKFFVWDKTVSISNNSIYDKRSSGWSHADFKSFFLEQAAHGSLLIETDWNFYPTDSDRFDCLQPVDELNDKINQISSHFKADGVIGIHIRRTDHTVSIQESPLGLFFETMRNEKRNSSDVRFFVATDDLSVQNDLIKEFGDSVLFYSTEKRRNTAQAIKEAVVDLYCLANTSRILGSYWSSFSETASELKDTPLTIIRKQG